MDQLLTLIISSGDFRQVSVTPVRRLPTRIHSDFVHGSDIVVMIARKLDHTLLLLVVYLAAAVDVYLCVANGDRLIGIA